MKFFDAYIDLPVEEYSLTVTIAKPRKPTTFEWMIVFIVDKYRESEINSSSLRDIFNAVLGVNDVDVFLTQAVDELTSASLNILVLNDGAEDPLASPISAFELTDAGHELVKTGQLPSAPQNKSKRLYYDFINQEVTDSKSAFTPGPKFPTFPVEMFFGTGSFPEIPLREKLQEMEGGDVVVSGLYCNKTQSFYRATQVKIELNEHVLTVNVHKKPLVEEYLQKISLDMARTLFFSEQFSVSAEVSDRVHSLTSDMSCRTPRAFVDNPSPGLKIFIHNSTGCVTQNPEAIIRVVYDVEREEGASFDDEHNCLKVSIAQEFPWEINGFSDLHHVWEIAKFQLQFNGEFLSLPIAVEYECPQEQKTTVLEKMFQKISQADSWKKYAFLLYLFQHKKTYRDHIIQMLKQENDLVLVFRHIETCFSTWGDVCDLGALLKETLSWDDLNSISEYDKFLNVLSSVHFVPAFLQECKARIAVAVDKISVETLDDWNSKIAVLQRCGRTSFDAQLEELIDVAPKNSEKDLLEYTRAVGEVLRIHGLASGYSSFLQRLLPIFLGDKKVPLDVFLKLVENITKECDDVGMRKGMYCLADQFVVLPEPWLERIDFAHECIHHGIPVPQTIFLNSTAEHIVTMNWVNDTNRAGFLNSLPQLRPLMDLNAVCTALARQIGIPTLYDYTILPDEANYQEIQNLCAKWQKKWTKAAAFFDTPENYCRSTIAIIGKVLVDAQEALRLMNRKKYLVFDTCALIHKPEILQCRSSNVVFVVPKVVIQELDSKKKDFSMSDEDRKNVREAIRLIKKNSPLREDSAPDLLPEDYRRNPTNDDLIMSVALKFAAGKEDVILVVDDTNFSNKCEGEDIPVLTVQECYQKIKQKEL